MPLADLFLWGTAAAPADGIESAMNAGQDFIGGELCDHFAFRQGKLDWQIWIAAGGKPLPRKLVVTNRADEAGPQSVSLIEWQLKPGFPDSIFTFVPPKGSQSVELRALDGKQGRTCMNRTFASRAAIPLAVLALASLALAPIAEARERGPAGGGQRAAATAGGVGGGARQIDKSRRDVRSNDVRNTSVNNVSSRNTNVNVNRNVNVDVDRRGCCGGWDNDYHPVATAAAVTATVAVTAAVVGSIVRSVPANCVPVNYGGIIYQQCGNTWYQPQGGQYVVINPPY